MRTPEAKKRFGQNFLHDEHVIDKIVRAIAPKPGDRLIEIGPGPGALTRPLLEALGSLTVIELDRDMIPFLRENCGDHPGLQIIQADALKFDFAALASDRKLRLCGNLPYNISTPLLFHLLSQAHVIRDMHFMLQKEVVRRMCAEPDTDDYGRLTVTLAARAQCEELFVVGSGAFKPAPQVDSAVVRVTPRPPPFAIADLPMFDRVVTAAFGQRRKTLRNALRGLLDESQIRAAGIEPQARAETLSPAMFAQLSARMAMSG
jgi:16S rRNA (adenine1518-N6/adenine1519-N6)-dimethyltransferase